MVVDDGQIMVLGGLLKDEYGGSLSQVPFLGDLPVRRTAVPQRQPHAHQEQPDGLPAADDHPQPGRLNALSMDRYDLIRAAQQGVGQPRQSVIMPINDAPVAPLPPVPTPGTPFRNGTVPPPLSWPEATPPRPAASAPAAAPPLPPVAPAAPPRRAGAGPDAVARMGTRHPLPYAFAKANTLLLEDDGTQLVLWAAETTPSGALSEVNRLFDVDGFEREPASTLANRIAVAYAGAESSAAIVVGEVESAVDLSRLMQDLPAVEDLLEASNDAPIIRMLNALLTQAVKDGASDIHIEPYERSSAVRFRVDGSLREVVQPNRALHAALISRLKIMAELDISEKRLPQDGRISLARRRPRHRRARVHAGQRARRARGAAAAGQERIEVHARRPGHERRRAQVLRPAGAPAARHRARHRAHRLGQDDHAVRVAGAHRHQPHQPADGGRPDRIRAAGHRPDAGQRRRST